MAEPQVLTMTAWSISQPAAKRLSEEHGVEERQNPIAIMAMNSINLKTTTLCHMGAFILRELGRLIGLERASEIVFQTAQTMTMKAQFKTGPDPAEEYGDQRPEWDRGPTEEDFEDDWGSDEDGDYEDGS